MRRAGADSPSASAAAVAQVVFPTPPLPATRRSRTPAGASSGAQATATPGPRDVRGRRAGCRTGARRRVAGERAGACRGSRTRGRSAAVPLGSSGSSGTSRTGRPGNALRTAAMASRSARTRWRSSVPFALRRRRHPVHEDLADRDAAGLQRAYRIARLLDGEHLRQDHPPEPAPAGIAQKAGQAAGLGVDLRDEAVGGIPPVPAGEAGQQEMMLRQHLPRARPQSVAGIPGRPGAGACGPWAPYRRRAARTTRGGHQRRGSSSAAKISSLPGRAASTRGRCPSRRGRSAIENRADHIAQSAPSLIEREARRRRGPWADSDWAYRTRRPIPRSCF